jgi:hypothetical protein
MGVLVGFIEESKGKDKSLSIQKKTKNVSSYITLEDIYMRFKLYKEEELTPDEMKKLQNIKKNWEMTESDFIKEGINYNDIIIDDFATVGTGSTPSRENDNYFKGENNWVLTSEVSMNEIFETSEKLSDDAIKDYGLKIYPENTILIAMYGQGKTRGQTALLKIPASITQNCGAIVVNTEIANPKYIWYFLMSIYDKIRGQDYSGGGVPHLNLSIVKNIRVPLPDISVQEQIVSELESQISLFYGLRKMQSTAQNKINQILSDVWGVEFVEPMEEEIKEEAEIN